MSGQPSGTVFADQDEHDKFLVEGVLRRVAEARCDPAAFFSFVMREEHGDRRRIVATAHQRVLMSFVMAHPRSVVRMPPGFSKTFAMASLAMWELGKDATARGAVISATQELAMKPVGMVRDYIGRPDDFPELNLVFPKLLPSPYPHDSWTQTKLVVDRPPGIRDASLVAIGMSGSLPGSRLSWMLVDDLLTEENTRTVEGRKIVKRWFDTTVLSRRDVRGSRICVTNTAWNPDDLTYALERAGWPTIELCASGDIRVSNAPDWDSPEIRPSKKPGEVYRLTAHDAGELDADESVPLWPERFGVEVLLEFKASMPTFEYDQLYENRARNASDMRCKREWVEACKAASRDAGYYAMCSDYNGPNATFTGCDIGVGKEESNAKTAVFTFEQLADGRRKLLHAKSGHWSGPDIIRELAAETRSFNSIARVENNACFVAGTPVLTRSGYVPIEAVKVGDEVWTHAKRWRPVVDTLRGTAATLADVRVAGVPALSASPNHWFRMREVGRTPGRGGGHHRPMGNSRWISCGFADKSAYCELAIPEWEACEAVLRLEVTAHKAERVIAIDESVALLLGLFMAEGHHTRGQVVWTFARSESYLAEFVERETFRVTGRCCTARQHGDGTLRVVASNKQLARALSAFGKGAMKSPPIAWFGWPLVLRLAMVRGWLMGDGCVRENNASTLWPRRFLSGASISRNWILFARTALMQAGYRPTIAKQRCGEYHFDERSGGRQPIYTLALNAEDSFALRSSMTALVEALHWPPLRWDGRRSNSQIVTDELGVWARLKSHGKFSKPCEPVDVFNLVVADDASYVADDVVVHNAQDFILQFALDDNASMLLRAHTTGRNKVHPEHGVECLFVEFANTAWLIPNDPSGNCPEAVEEFLVACYDFKTGKHCGDLLMACWFAREEARECGYASAAQSRREDVGSITDRIHGLSGLRVR